MLLSATQIYNAQDRARDPEAAKHIARQKLVAEVGGLIVDKYAHEHGNRMVLAVHVDAPDARAFFTGRALYERIAGGIGSPFTWAMIGEDIRQKWDAVARDLSVPSWQPIDTAPHEGDMLVRGGMFHHGDDAGPWPLEGSAHVRRLGRVFEVLNSRGAPTIVNPTEWKPV